MVQSASLHYGVQSLPKLHATLHHTIWVVYPARRIRVGSILFYEWTGTLNVAPPRKLINCCKYVYFFIFRVPNRTTYTYKNHALIRSLNIKFARSSSSWLCYSNLIHLHYKYIYIVDLAWSSSSVMDYHATAWGRFLVGTV